MHVCTSMKYGAGLSTRFVLEHAASTVLSKKEFVPKGYLAYMEDKLQIQTIF